MTVLTSNQAESEAVVTIAKLIMAAVATSPKTRGVSDVTCLLIQGEEQERLANLMEEHGAMKSFNTDIFLRDAKNVRQAAAVILIGVKGTRVKRPEKPFNCGSCGYPTCGHFERARKGKKGEDFIGPICSFQALDLGVAIGVAAKMAGELNLDNRLMYTAGAAAMELKILEADLIVGLPLSISQKNIFFDRG